jgi:hypothetical protein
MPDRDALNETLQRLAEALGVGGATPPGPAPGQPAEQAVLRPVLTKGEARSAGVSLELPPGVQVAGNFLCAGDAHRPLALHFEEGALHVVVSTDRADGTEQADGAARRNARPARGLRLRIEILLDPSPHDEVH